MVTATEPYGLPGKVCSHSGSRPFLLRPADEFTIAGDEDAEVRRVRHRKSLAEPEPPPKRLSVREERALLRALLDRPPYDRD